MWPLDSLQQYYICFLCAKILKQLNIKKEKKIIQEVLSDVEPFNLKELTSYFLWIQVTHKFVATRQDSASTNPPAPLGRTRMGLMPSAGLLDPDSAAVQGRIHLGFGKTISK